MGYSLLPQTDESLSSNCAKNQWPGPMRLILWLQSTRLTFLLKQKKRRFMEEDTRKVSVSVLVRLLLVPTDARIAREELITFRTSSVPNCTFSPMLQTTCRSRCSKARVRSLHHKLKAGCKKSETVSAADASACYFSFVPLLSCC